MMAFIEQEANEKVEEIDAKVTEACLPVSLVAFVIVTTDLMNLLLHRRRKSSTLRKVVWCRLSG